MKHRNHLAHLLLMAGISVSAISAAIAQEGEIISSDEGSPEQAQMIDEEVGFAPGDTLPQEEPEEAAEGVRAPSPISALGERLALEEFNHRRAMADRGRTLERERISAQIAEQEATKARLIRQRKDAERQVPAVGMMPTQSLGAIPPIPVAAPPRPPAIPPRVIGVIGDTAVFTVSGSSVRAGVGEVVGDFRVATIDGRRVELVEVADAANKVTLTVR